MANGTLKVRLRDRVLSALGERTGETAEATWSQPLFCVDRLRAIWKPSSVGIVMRILCGESAAIRLRTSMTASVLDIPLVSEELHGMNRGVQGATAYFEEVGDDIIGIALMCSGVLKASDSASACQTASNSI